MRYEPIWLITTIWVKFVYSIVCSRLCIEILSILGGIRMQMSQDKIRLVGVIDLHWYSLTNFIKIQKTYNVHL